MINIIASKDARITVKTFMGYIMCNTDWQDWVRLQGQKLGEHEGMEITLHSATKVEVKTFVNQSSSSTILEWDDFPDKSKEERNQLWIQQWGQLDKLIRDFTEK